MAQHSNWICPQCGLNDISGDTYKCPRCGKKRNRWGYWDCASCQTKGIRADHKECPNCGRPRVRNVKFYLRDDLVEFVDEVSGQDAVRIRRPNWICPYCNQQNDDAVDVCVYCNAARTESKESYHDVPNPNQPAPQPAAPQKTRHSKIRGPRQIRRRTNCCSCLVIAFPVIAVFVIAAISLIVNKISSQKIRTADAYDAYWKCDIYVEECRTFHDNDWELPEYGRLLETRVQDYTYIDHYERRSREVWVEDYDNDDDDWGGGGGWDDGGWEDYGDGQFGVFHFPNLMLGAAPMPAPAAFHYETEWYDEPVYRTVPRDRYYYEYDAWVYSRTVSTTGTSDTTPYFDTLSLADMERESERTTRYLLDFTSFKGEAVTLSVPEELFMKIIQAPTFNYRRDVTGVFENDPQYILVIDGTEYTTQKTVPDIIPDTTKPVYENGDAYLHPERVPAPFVLPD